MAAFTPVPEVEQPEPDDIDLSSLECRCPNPDDQYTLEIQYDSMSIKHVACGLPLGSWADDALSMGPVPVTMTWHSTADYYSGEVDAWGELAIRRRDPGGPEHIVICGSTRFTDQMADIQQLLTWHGHAVFAPTSCNLKAPNPLWADPADAQAGAARLATLHNAMIDDADWVLVVGDYAGESTTSEIEHARSVGKTVRFTDPAIARTFGGEVWTPETAATS